MNTITTAAQIANELIAQLYDRVVFATMINRTVQNSIGAGTGNKTIVRKPARFVANKFNRATGIILQDVEETDVVVELTDIPDVSWALTVENLSVDTTDFINQYIAPAGQAVAEYIEKLALSLRYDVTSYILHTGDLDTTVDAAAALDERSVDDAQRMGAYPSRQIRDFRKDDNLRNANKSADGGAALRRGEIGDVTGISNFQANAIKDGVGVVFDPMFGTLVTRDLGTPLNQTMPLTDVINNRAPVAVNVSLDSFAVRLVGDYDINKKQYVFSVDTWVGVKTLDPAKAVLVAPAEGLPAAYTGKVKDDEGNPATAGLVDEDGHFEVVPVA